MKRETVLNKIEGKTLPLRYMKRAHYFQNYKNSCGFDAETFKGHSYNWYELSKRIDGVVVLNTYSYSNQTAKHWRKFREMFEILGVKYKTLEAPRGLQDLKTAHAYNLEQLADAMVAERYARIKGNSNVQHYKKQLKILERFGCKTSKAALSRALAAAENDRQVRNADARKRAAERRALKAIELVIDAENKRASEVGLHVVYPYGLSKYSEERARREALAKGFTRIFVHRSEPRPLSIVGGAQ